MAADLRTASMPPELCGDLFALNFIDLEKEGLAEYKPFLTSYNAVNNINNSFPRTRSLSRHIQGAQTIRRSPSQIPVKGGNGRPSRLDSVLDRIFSEVNVNYDGKISLDEAKRIFNKLNQMIGKEFNETMITNMFKSIGVYSTCFIDFEEFKRSLKDLL